MRKKKDIMRSPSGCGRIHLFDFSNVNVLSFFMCMICDYPNVY